jgi:hypothetical protein
MDELSYGLFVHLRCENKATLNAVMNQKGTVVGGVTDCSRQGRPR